MNGTVSALAVMGPNLYAGGDFTTAGGVSANCIAKWDGNSWSTLGSGVGESPYPGIGALAVMGTNLYAGGRFTTAGGVSANYIAKWDGSVWSALGSGMAGWDHEIDALAVIGTNFYAGGSFGTAGGVVAKHIAKWDGSVWSALGSGIDTNLPWNSWVSALAADGAGHLFVGGAFLLAGTNVSPFIAQANVGPGIAGGEFGSPAFSPLTGFRCIFRDATPGYPYRIQGSPSLVPGSWTDFTNFTYTGPTVITDISPAAVPKKFYRAVTP
jgi:hypothetical protein